MPYVELRAELLAAREQRELRRLRVNRLQKQTLVQVSLNLPGMEKSPPGAKQLFLWGLQQVLRLLPRIESCDQGRDPLGHWALLGSFGVAEKLKREAVQIESSNPAGRLLDIDIFSPRGQLLGRQELALPLRPCLLCEQAAVDCIRQKNHTHRELKERVDELLLPFRA